MLGNSSEASFYVMKILIVICFLFIKLKKKQKETAANLKAAAKYVQIVMPSLCNTFVGMLSVISI